MSVASRPHEEPHEEPHEDPHARELTQSGAPTGEDGTQQVPADEANAGGDHDPDAAREEDEEECEEHVVSLFAEDDRQSTRWKAIIDRLEEVSDAEKNEACEALEMVERLREEDCLNSATYKALSGVCRRVHEGLAPLLGECVESITELYQEYFVAAYIFSTRVKYGMLREGASIVEQFLQKRVDERYRRRAYFEAHGLDYEDFVQWTKRPKRELDEEVYQALVTKKRKREPEGGDVPTLESFLEEKDAEMAGMREKARVQTEGWLRESLEKMHADDAGSPWAGMAKQALRTAANAARRATD